MNITILCSDAEHPVNSYLKHWMKSMSGKAKTELVRRKEDALGGDLLFLISCTEIVTRKDRARYNACLLLHASALPKGRGWSPHVWELVNGASGITVSLLEAEDAVDSGRIWSQRQVMIPRHALWNEINDLLFEAEIDLMTYAVQNYGAISPVEQPLEGATYYQRRTQDDSEIDPEKTIAEQFDLIRVCDPQRFPAYFHHRGHRYVLKLEKHDGE